MIEIHQPALEALIQQRLVDGGFADIEAVLTQALTDAPLPPRSSISKLPTTGAELVAGLMNSPCKEVDLERASYTLPVSEPVIF